MTTKRRRIKILKKTAMRRRTTRRRRRRRIWIWPPPRVKREKPSKTTRTRTKTRRRRRRRRCEAHQPLCVSLSFRSHTHRIETLSQPQPRIVSSRFFLQEENGKRGGGARKRKRRTGGAAFIDDEAEDEDGDDEDDDDEGDVGDEIDAEELEAARREVDSRLHARFENAERMERFENEEELEKMIKERYRKPRYADAAIAEDVVDQESLRPTVNQDAKLWMVRNESQHAPSPALSRPWFVHTDVHACVSRIPHRST